MASSEHDRPPRRVYLGIGSNLGDRWAYLSEAVRTLRQYGEHFAVSAIYETKPVGGPSEQGRYLNCVVRFETAKTPHEILDLAHDCEQHAHRVRAERFGPRTLDVDVLLIDGYISDDPSLTVPHPRMRDRAFVLAPLEELDPKLVPPHWRDDMGGPDVVNGEIRKVGQLVT